MKNISVLESYNSILDIIFIYAKNLITKNQNVTNSILNELNLGFLNDEVERNYRLIERSKNGTLKQNLKNFYTFNKPKKIAYPFLNLLKVD